MRVVGRVSVKVWPDTSEFRKRAKAQLEKASKGLKVEIPLELDDDQSERELRRQTLRLKRLAASNPVKIPVELDFKHTLTDLRAMLNTLKRVAKLNPLDVTPEVNTSEANAGLSDFIQRFTKDLKDQKVKVKTELDWSPSDITNARNAFRDSMKGLAAKVGLDVAREDIHRVRQNIRQGLDNLRAEIRLDYDETGLGRIEKRLKETFQTKIKPSLDNTATALVKLELQRIFNETKAKVKATLDRDNLLRIKAQLATAFRDVKVKVKTVLDKKSVRAVFTALAALSGSRLVKEVWRIDLLKDFDKMLPMIALVGTALGALGAQVIALSGDLLVLGKHLAQIVPIGLAVPGVLTGILIGMRSLKRVFKDMKKELPQVRKGFKEIGESISKNFWAVAKGPMGEFADKALPKIKTGMDKVATSQGKWFAEFSRGLTSQVLPAMDGWFNSLTRFTDALGGMAGPLASIVRHFGDLGAHYMPIFGKWIATITTDFSNFLGNAMQTGEAFLWVDTAVQRIQELWNVITGVSRVLSLLAGAAEDAGSATLAGLGESLHAMADGLRANFGMVVTVFRSANEAMTNLANAAGPGLSAMFSAMGQSISTVLPLIGEVAGLLIGSLGTILAQPLVGEGVLAFFTGLRSALQTLQPALKDVGEGLGMLLVVGGTMLSSFAPTLSLAFTGAGSAATGLLSALNAVIPVLSKGLFDALSAILPVFREITPALSNFIVLIGVQLGAALSAIAPTLGQMASGLGTLFTALLEVVGSLVTKLLNFLVPVIQMLGPVFQSVAASLAPLVTKLGEMATGLIDWLAPIVQQFLADFLPKFQEAWNNLVSALGPVLDGIQQLANFLGPILGPIISFLLTLIGDSFIGILNGLANTFAGVTQFIMGIVNAFSAAFRGDWTALGDALKQIWNGLWQTIMGVVEVVLNVGVLGILKKGWALIKALFTDGGAGIKTIWSTVWNGIKDLAGTTWDAIKALVGRGLDGIKSATRSGMDMLKGIAQNAWSAFANAVRTGVDTAVNIVRSLPGKITSALGNLGSLLINSGRSMLEGLAQGIRSGVSAAVGAAKSAMQAVRNLFPFSPAKEGPFSGKGWTLYSGRSIAESIGDGIADRVGYARNAAEALAAATRTPLDGDLSMTNSRRISVAHDATKVSTGNSYVFNLEVDMEDIDQVGDLVEFAETLRRKARAFGGKK